MASSYSERVAAEVRAEMARQRRTQGDIAAALGWSQQFLSRRLTGDQPFALDEIEALASELGVPISQFSTPFAREAAS